MPHNFRIIQQTASYVSKAGNDDATAGAAPNTPDIPFITIARAGQTNVNYVIIGTGQYAEASFGPLYNCTYRADGRVFVKGNGTGSVFAGQRVILVDIEVADYEYLLHGAVYPSGGNNWVSAYRCIFRNGKVVTCNDINTSNSILVDCILLNATAELEALQNPGISGDTAESNQVHHCLFFSSNLIYRGFQFPVACYFDPLSNLTCTDAARLPRNCNIRGTLSIMGTLYPNLAAAAVAYPALLATNVNLDPRFNNEFAEDFTLRQDSPHLTRAIGPRHLRYASSVFFDGPDGDVTATSGHFFRNLSTNETVPLLSATNLVATRQNGQLRLKVKESAVANAPLIGMFRTGPIRIGQVPREITRLGFSAGLTFDTSFPAFENQFDANNPQPLNNNVPNTNNWASGLAGRNPNRQETAVRWSNKDNPQDGVVTDWVTADAFVIFEWNTQPLYNPAGSVGNGSPNFLLASQATVDNAPRPPQAMFVQFEITLMNNYFSK